MNMPLISTGTNLLQRPGLFSVLAEVESKSAEGGGNEVFDTMQASFLTYVVYQQEIVDA